MRKVGILSFEQFDNRRYDTVGSSRIRARWLLNHWPEAEEFYYGEPYDVVIYQKAYFRQHIKEYTGKKIFDICDKDWPDVVDFVELMEYMDAIVTSTQPLADEIQKMLPEKLVVCIPDRVDFSLVKRIKTEYGSGPIRRAVWYGYFHNFQTVQPALPDLANRNIDLTVISDEHPVTIRNFGLEVTSRPFVPERLYEDICEHDVVLNPRKTVGKWLLKSNNKTIIAQALGIPVAETLDQLDYLQDPKNRKLEVERAFEHVKKNYDVKQSVDEYRDLINKL